MQTMLAARYLGRGRIEAVSVPVPRLEEQEALLAVEACGFCGSDLNIVAGTHPRARAPLTLGHELSGRIAQLSNPSSEFAVGDRVTVYPLIMCGVCWACTHGQPHVCRQLRLYGFDSDGGMAQFLRVPVSSLLKLPREMSPQTGALIEPLAVAVHGVARAGFEDVQLAIVLGAGPIGLLAALVLRAQGVPHVLISDVLPSRLQLAGELGLEAMAAGDELHARVMELSGENGADAVFECAGHASSAAAMTALVRSRGVIVNLGVFKKPVPVDMQAINFKEVTLVGSRVYEREDFRRATELAALLPLDRIISHTFPIRDVRAAFEQFRSGDVCKVLIEPGRDA